MAIIRKATPEYMTELEQYAKKRKDEILSCPDSCYSSENVFYISNDGSDGNDGRSPESPWLTLSHLGDDIIVPGSVVHFKRGGIWRDGFTAREGVTYTAYGNGEKPRIYGSPYDAAHHGKWELTDVPDVYVYSERIGIDVGGIFFDNASAHAVKLIPNYIDGVPVFDRTYKEKFSSYKDLHRDLDFFHDFGEPVTTSEAGGLLYLCSKKGNPSERFNEIELNLRKNVIAARGHNITFDNIAVMYGGAHGIGAGTINGLTVKNCFIGYIGGGIQFYRDGVVTRFGNGIEIYGGCKDFTIDNCYVTECYDAGITHQLSKGGTNECLHINVNFTNNLIDNCVYGIEYFLGRSEGDSARREMHDIFYRNNFIRNSGSGWGNERPDTDCQAAIKGWDHGNEAYNFVIENNILEYSSWNLLHNGCTLDEWGPSLKNNTFITCRNAGLARYGANPSKQYLFNNYTAASPIFCDNTFVYMNSIPSDPDRYENAKLADTYQPL
ncbi:MAG: right-handed parallel beta-helix repeat-containing protein [Clostridia bacterium]|nr:right-handed parallel beta-helix repeat-containing protein [Clostridia bacterium]